MRTFVVAIAVLIVMIVSPATSRAQAGDSAGGVQIVDMKLGKEIQERELTGEDSSFAKDSKVYLWMKVTGATSDSISVKWTAGSHEYTAKLFIGGSPWRTWAAKTVSFVGDWSVSVSDAAGNVLKEAQFKVE